MDEQLKSDLMGKGYSPYEVAQYRCGDRPELDVAAGKVPQSFEMAGSTRETAAGGRGLTCWIALEDDSFVVYLPPEDPTWGSRSQIVTPGYRPSQKGAECEFDRWLDQFCRHGD